MLSLVVLAATGLMLLTVAADQLVIGCGRLAARLGVPAVAVSVVVIGLGTSAPEFVVSGLAAARGDAGLALGNLVGSNIINVTLILGVAGLIRPVTVRSSVPRREAPLAAAGVALFTAAATPTCSSGTCWAATCSTAWPAGPWSGSPATANPHGLACRSWWRCSPSPC